MVTGKKESKKAAKRTHDFIYDDNKGLLYFNENGEQKGFGNGGLVARLGIGVELDASDLMIV